MVGNTGNPLRVNGVEEAPVRKAENHSGRGKQHESHPVPWKGACSSLSRDHEINRQLLEKGTQMANNYFSRCSTVLVKRGMKVNSTLRSYSAP